MDRIYVNDAMERLHKAVVASVNEAGIAGLNSLEIHRVLLPLVDEFVTIARYDITVTRNRQLSKDRKKTKAQTSA